MDQNTLIILLIGVIIVGFIFFYRQLQTLREDKEKDKLTGHLMKWLEDSRKGNESMQNRLDAVNKAINERLDNAAKGIGSVGKQGGEVSEIGHSPKEFQEFLRSPKLRGNIGEHVLRELLGQFLPKESFHLQYRFRSGEI